MNGVAVGFTVRLGLNSRFERLYERRRRWFTRPFVPGVWAKTLIFQAELQAPPEVLPGVLA
jgi:hypothetical protein